MSVLGHSRRFRTCRRYVRSTQNSRHFRTQSAFRICATSGHPPGRSVQVEKICLVGNEAAEFHKPGRGLTGHRPTDTVCPEDEPNRLAAAWSRKMNNTLTVLLGAFLSAVWLIPAAMAEPACVTQNMGVPAGANISDKAAPFFIDTTGLDFKTAPPTRDPSNPNYPRATELPDGTLPPAGAEGNSSSGRPMHPRPRPSRRMVFRAARPPLSPCRRRTA